MSKDIGLFAYINLIERRYMESRKIKFKYPNIPAEIARHGDTKTKVAGILGISTNQLNKKINGQYDFTISEIEKLCIYYDKDYYELFKGE